MRPLWRRGYRVLLHRQAGAVESAARSVVGIARFEGFSLSMRRLTRISDAY